MCFDMYIDSRCDCWSSELRLLNCGRMMTIMCLKLIERAIKIQCQMLLLCLKDEMEKCEGL